MLSTRRVAAVVGLCTLALKFVAEHTMLARREPELIADGGTIAFEGLNKNSAGCCRFAEGTGTYTLLAVTAPADCEAFCLSDPACMGYEASGWKGCELHTLVPSFANSTVGCTCKKKVEAAVSRGRRVANLSTVGVTKAPLETEVLIIVLSRRTYDARAAIRETWGKGHANIRFVVGSCCRLPQSKVNPWTCTLHPSRPAPLKQELDRRNAECSDADLRLEQESETFNDIIFASVVDVYRHLPQKLKAGYQWAMQNSSASWIVKTDDDSVVRVADMTRYLRTTLDASVPTVYGYIAKGWSVHRNGKWAEHTYAPSIYPAFPVGSHGHVVSRPVAKWIAGNQHVLTNYQGEDVSVGIWLDRSPLKSKIKWIMSKHTANHGNCFDASLWMIGHDISATKMRQCFGAATKYISIKPVGRLGNLMFEHASAYGLAQQLDVPFCIDRGNSEFSFSMLRETFGGPFPPYCTHQAAASIAEAGYAMHDAFIVGTLRQAKTSATLNGYFQSWRYFEGIAPTIRSLFVFKPDIMVQARNTLTRERNHQYVGVVGIHVRRGDYIKYGYLKFPPTSYFKSAMALFPHHQFIVLTEDVAWCREQPFFGNTAVKIMPTGRAGPVDMAILTLCDGIILTIGTFGWWGGWLAKDARVVYYDNVFKLNHPVNKGKVRYKDHFSPRWTAVGDRPTTNDWGRFLPSTNAGPDWCPPKNSAGSKFVQSQYAKIASKFAGKCKTVKRVGGDGDGGKLICTDFIQKNNCIVYSLGSRLDFSFEIDVVNQLGCRVHTFDCTVGTPKSADIPPGVAFHPWCVGGKNEVQRISSDLGHQGETGQYYTLGTIRAKLGHKSVDLLKMDIERHEFAAIATLTGANVPQQIAFETHLHNAYGMWGRPVQKREWTEMWTTLAGLGFRIFSHEPNPFCQCCCEFSINRAALPTKKKSVPNTIVTAYFEIPSKHLPKEYNAWMANMLSMQDAMVIYTTVDLVSKIERLRSHATDLTLIVPISLEDTRMGSRYDATFWKKQHLMDPEKGAHKDVRLFWVWNEKAEFLWRTVGSNPFQSTFFAWVDIGYFRTSAQNGQYMIRHIPPTLKKNQVLMLNVSPLLDVKRWGNYVGGGFIGGYADGIQQWHAKYYAQLNAHKHEFIGKDQPWMWKTCDANPGLCELVVPDKEHGDPWFYMAPYMMGETQGDANDNGRLAYIVQVHNAEIYKMVSLQIVNLERFSPAFEYHVVLASGLHARTDDKVRTHHCPKRGLADCMDYAFEKVVPKLASKLVISLNVDMFLLKPWDPLDYMERLGNPDIVAVIEDHASAAPYLHPGLMVMNRTSVAPLIPRFQYVPGSDVGGATLPWLLSHPHLRVKPMVWSRHFEMETLRARHLVTTQTSAFIQRFVREGQVHTSPVFGTGPDLYTRDFAWLHLRDISCWSGCTKGKKRFIRDNLLDFVSNLSSQETALTALKEDDFECWACATTTTGRPPRLVEGGWFLPLHKQAPNTNIQLRPYVFSTDVADLSGGAGAGSELNLYNCNHRCSAKQYCFLGRCWCLPGWSGQGCLQRMVYSKLETERCPTILSTNDVLESPLTVFDGHCTVHPWTNQPTACGIFCNWAEDAGITMVSKSIWDKVNEQEFEHHKTYRGGTILSIPEGQTRWLEYMHGFDSFRALSDVPLGDYLEVGAGMYTQLLNVMKYRPETMPSSITLIEPSIHRYQKLPGCTYADNKLMGQSVTLIDGTVETYNRVEAFDSVLVVNVIEHVLDASNFLTSIFKALRPNGILIWGERYFEDPDEPSTRVLGSTLLHPIRLTKTYVEHFLSLFDPVYKNSFDTPQSKIRGNGERGIFFVGRKRSESKQAWMDALFDKADEIDAIVQTRAASNDRKKPLPSLPPPARTNLNQTPRRYSPPEYRRDTSFYWRYVYNGTDHPTQEVPCSKRPGQKYWAITYADGAVRNRIARMHTRPSCLLHGIDEFRIFGPNDLDPEYRRRNQNLLSATHGVGLWIWKHAVQYRTLFEMKDDDILLYIDSDFRCDPSILQYMCLAQTNDIVGFHHSNADYTLSKLASRDSMILMGLDTSAVATSVQSSGGNVIYRKTPTTIAFVREMAAWSQQEAVVGNRGVPSRYGEDWPAYKQGGFNHQCDQAISSLMFVKYRIKTYPWHMEGYGAGSDDALNQAQRRECGLNAHAMTIHVKDDMSVSWIEPPLENDLVQIRCMEAIRDVENDYMSCVPDTLKSCLKDLAANMPLGKDGQMKAHHWDARTAKWNEQDRWRPLGLKAPCLVWYVGANTHGRDGVRLQQDYPCDIHVFEPVQQFASDLRRNWKYVPRSTVHDYGLGASTRTVEGVDVKGESTFAMEGSDKGATLQIRGVADVWRDLGSPTIDLLHANCEGCEWELWEALLNAGIVPHIRTIQIGTHWFPQIKDIEQRYCAIETKLKATHANTFKQAFGWERWSLR